MLVRLLLQLFLGLWLLAPAAWSLADEFCGPGPHPATSSCVCRQELLEKVCWCRTPMNDLLLTLPGKERLPLSETTALALPLCPDCQQLALPSPAATPAWVHWSQAPPLPPPRLCISL